MDKYINEYDSLFRHLQQLTSELEKQVTQNKKAEQEIADIRKDMEFRTAETSSATKELTKQLQLCQVAKENCNKVEAEKQNLEKKVDELNSSISNIRDVECVATRRELESMDKNIAQLKGECEVLRKKQATSEKSARTLMDLIQLNKNGKLNLSIELKALQDESHYQKNQITSILAEKEKLEHDGEVANQTYYTTLEELKLQELQISELNNKIAADNTKLKMKQNLFESVRADRNLYSKQLVDSQDEIARLRREFRTMNHSIDQMKEEISIKDNAIVKEHFCHHSVEKEREILKNEITKIKKQLHSSDTIVENQRVEIMKLQRIIDEADKEAQRQAHELAAIMSERNLITGQLVKRNSLFSMESVKNN
jgi:chromosome segregation ATPase